MKDLLEEQLCKIGELEKELEYEKQKNFRRSDMIFDLLKENKSITENSISKDKIKEKIEILKEEKSESTDSIEASKLLSQIYLLQGLLEE